MMAGVRRPGHARKVCMAAGGSATFSPNPISALGCRHTATNPRLPRRPSPFWINARSNPNDEIRWLRSCGAVTMTLICCAISCGATYAMKHAMKSWCQCLLPQACGATACLSSECPRPLMLAEPIESLAWQRFASSNSAAAKDLPVEKRREVLCGQS